MIYVFGSSFSTSKQTICFRERLIPFSEIAASTPDVRSDLVAKVKDKIKDPNYINSAVISSVADRFLDSIGL